ncbi:hypothetical protein B0H63DRAFT_467977 [Podospora didyma]|uniref:Uncharacterized protein n=1 Tax=Podospora didyma TaxID=330526 RepID=A0AAE0NS04_9PEZI|nr:hypothetical protein B0H63DRAFT_467977 [Podospora didyma]
MLLRSTALSSLLLGNNSEAEKITMLLVGGSNKQSCTATSRPLSDYNQPTFGPSDHNRLHTWLSWNTAHFLVRG